MTCPLSAPIIRAAVAPKGFTILAMAWLLFVLPGALVALFVWFAFVGGGGMDRHPPHQRR